MTIVTAAICFDQIRDHRGGDPGTGAFLNAAAPMGCTGVRHLMEKVLQKQAHREFRDRRQFSRPRSPRLQSERAQGFSTRQHTRIACLLVVRRHYRPKQRERDALSLTNEISPQDHD